MIKRLVSLAALMLALAACTAGLDNLMNETRLVNPDDEDMMFYATLEGESDADAQTKVYADEKMRVLWNADDRITIYKKTTYGYQYRFTGNEGANAGGFKVVSSDDEFITQEPLDYFYAVYPYSPLNDINYDGIVTLTLPERQTYKENSFGIGANTMVSVTSDNQLKFRNVGSFLSFRFYGDGVSVKSIKLKGNNNEKLAGAGKVTMALNGTPVIEMQNNATESITLNCETAVRLGATAADATEFWFVIPPTDFTKGITVTVTDQLGGTFVMNSAAHLTFERNKITLLSPKQVVPVPPAEPEAVDLGLSVKWATCNVGANSPEEYGEYFAWGETEPKGYYYWSTYKWCNGSGSTFTKYNTNNSYGTIDGKTVLELSDDAAHANWGGSWRMPTDAEWMELRTNCDWTSTTQNGVKGYLVKSRTNANSIFLPAAGYRYRDILFDAGSWGYYWSSSLTTDGPYLAWYEYFYSDGVSWNSSGRYDGFTVRPVYRDPVSVSEVRLNKSELTLYVGESERLTVAVLPENAAEKTVTWSSTKPSVASVDETGLVTSKEAGTATITAKAGEKEATCAVTVKAAPPVTDNIVFADAAAKYACVAKYDTNGDGEVSFEEAEAASSFDDLFTDWKTVKSFDEIKYFKNVHSLNGVFRGCDKLVSLAVPESITNIGTYAFDGCSSLTSVILPSGITAIGNYTFRNCSSLRSIDIPSNVVKIGSYTFSGCSLLTAVELPSSLTSIASYAFEDCSSLALVDIPSSVTSLGKYAFSGCSSLSAIVLPTNITSIPDGLFYYCSALKNITWPTSLQSIGACAFFGCVISQDNSVASVIELPSTVSNIGSKAFWGVRHLIMPSPSAIVIASDSFINYYTYLYVPSGMAEMYKVRTNWSNYERQLYTISDYPVSGCPEPELVDLGLPSGLKWASFNLGATKPEEYGAFFAWGEVEPKFECNWETYKWCKGSYKTLTKYCKTANDGYNGFTDNKTVLDLEDDAARVNLGGTWRIPTDAEWTELRENCTWTWTVQNGVKGSLVTSKTNSNSIFLPAAGFWDDPRYYYEGEEDGYYWSSSLDTGGSSGAWGVHFSINYVSRYDGHRFTGRSIRPVTE